MFEFPYFYAWRLTSLWGPPGSPLYRQPCRLIARAIHPKNARLVEFEGGLRHVVSGNALRKRRVA